MNKTLIALVLLVGLNGNIFSSTKGSDLPKCSSTGLMPSYHECFGEFNYSNGDRYVGEWVGAKKHGRGTLTFSLGTMSESSAYRLGTISESKYEGDWVNGQFHGEGIYTDIYGGSYVGQFKNGMRNGKGIYTYRKSVKEDSNASGNIQATYEGEWKDNLWHGQGKSFAAWTNHDDSCYAFYWS